MKRLAEELRIVSNTTWIIAVLLYVAMVCLMIYVTSADASMRTWPLWGQWLFALGVALPLGIYVILIGYVNADARRRGMRYVMWTLLATFVPNALGIILYFVLRDPLMTPCPRCSTLVRHGFAFCPACGASTGRTCPQCGKAVDPQWSHCTGCGAKVA